MSPTSAFMMLINFCNMSIILMSRHFEQSTIGPSLNYVLLFFDFNQHIMTKSITDQPQFIRRLASTNRSGLIDRCCLAISSILHIFSCPTKPGIVNRGRFGSLPNFLGPTFLPNGTLIPLIRAKNLSGVSILNFKFSPIAQSFSYTQPLS